MAFRVKDFKYNDIIVNCDFTTRVSILADDSGVGCSFLIKILMDYCRRNHIPCNHYDFDHHGIMPQDSGLVLIDRADLFLTNQHLLSLKSAGCSSIIRMLHSHRLDTSGCGKYALITTDCSIKVKRFR